MFGRVQTSAAAGGSGSADRVVQVDLTGSDVVLFVNEKTAQQYPASIRVETRISSFDATGRFLDQAQFQAQATGTVSTDGETCEVRGVDAIVQEAVEMLAEDFGDHLASSEGLRQGSAAASSVSPASAKEGSPTAPGAGRLIFRVIFTDQNEDQVLEGGEAMTLEVEVTNTGPSPVEGVQVALTGSPELIRPLNRLVQVGDLQSGESKSVRVSGKMAEVSAAGQAELVMTLGAATPGTRFPPSKRFVVALRPNPGKS